MNVRELREKLQKFPLNAVVEIETAHNPAVQATDVDWVVKDERVVAVITDYPVEQK